MTELLNRLLEMPVGPRQSHNIKAEATEQVVRRDGDSLEAEVAEESDLDQSLRDMNLNPAEWFVTGLKRSEWQTPSGETRNSLRYTLKRVSGGTEVPVDELIRALDEHVPPRDAVKWGGDAAYVIGIGDMQFGKIDGDGVAGALERCIDYMDSVAARIKWLQGHGVNIGHVHVAWLGDHIEGFNSQGGANAWRTQLPLTHQIRLTRRVMAYAMQVLAPLVTRLTMAAVPGNHGETVRFAGKGVTTFDDSHDTESLICVMEAAEGRPEYEHVEFYVPDHDELTVSIEAGGLHVLMAHGHQFAPNKHFDWWRGQAFHSDTAHASGILLTGHLHHDHIERDGKHLWVGVGSLESESTYYRHKTGSPGHPGMTGLLVRGGRVEFVDFIN